jgi:hypothetical protein
MMYFTFPLLETLRGIQLEFFTRRLQILSVKETGYHIIFASRTLWMIQQEFSTLRLQIFIRYNDSLAFLLLIILILLLKGHSHEKSC